MNPPPTLSLCSSESVSSSSSSTASSEEANCKTVSSDHLSTMFGNKLKTAAGSHKSMIVQAARKGQKEFNDKFPRIRLAQLPTPLEFCPRLSEALGGVEIYVKRDDCTGLATGGNKARKLGKS